MKIEGPQIKFWENISCVPYKIAKKTGARAEVGRGIKTYRLREQLKLSGYKELPNVTDAEFPKPTTRNTSGYG